MGRAFAIWFPLSEGYGRIFGTPGGESIAVTRSCVEDIGSLETPVPPSTLQVQSLRPPARHRWLSVLKVVRMRGV